MERWTFDSQATHKPRNWVGHTRASSVYTRAALHPRVAAAAIALLGLGLGAAAVRHRGAPPFGK